MCREQEAQNVEDRYWCAVCKIYGGFQMYADPENGEWCRVILGESARTATLRASRVV
jgi:hypothetical protein